LTCAKLDRKEKVRHKRVGIFLQGFKSRGISEDIRIKNVNID